MIIFWVFTLSLLTGKYTSCVFRFHSLHRNHKSKWFLLKLFPYQLYTLIEYPCPIYNTVFWFSSKTNYINNFGCPGPFGVTTHGGETFSYISFIFHYTSLVFLYSFPLFSLSPSISFSLFPSFSHSPPPYLPLSLWQNKYRIFIKGVDSPTQD